MYHYYRRAVGTFGSGPGSIRFNGREYMFRGYAYENFVDAYNYAQLLLLHPSIAPPSSPTARAENVHAPCEDDLDRMRKFGIVFVAGHYYYGAYRYDCLSDACAFARLAPGHDVSQHNVRIAHAVRHLNLLQERCMVDASGQALQNLPVGHLGHYDIFPQNAPTALQFKRGKRSK